MKDQLVASLTLGDIKSLAGLDDVCIVKGTHNFQRLRDIVDTLCAICDQTPTEKKSLNDRINETED